MERELFALFTRVIESMPDARRRPPKCQYTDVHIVLIWFWAVLHDRPIDWACRRINWPWHDRTRALPSGSTMSRRLRRESVRRLCDAALSKLQARCPDSLGVLVMDGKPLTTSGNSADPDAGFGRACGVMGKGYRLHAIADLAGNIRVHEVLPINVSEQIVARLLIERMPDPHGLTLLADANYDASVLYDLAAARGIRMIAGKRYKNARALGHVYQSPHRLEALALQARDPDVLAPRRRIESHFGTMGNVIGGLSPLPNSVRRLSRVRRWVMGKLIVDALHRLRRMARSMA